MLTTHSNFTVLWEMNKCSQFAVQVDQKHTVSKAKQKENSSHKLYDKKMLGIVALNTALWLSGCKIGKRFRGAYDHSIQQEPQPNPKPKVGQILVSNDQSSPDCPHLLTVLSLRQLGFVLCLQITVIWRTFKLVDASSTVTEAELPLFLSKTKQNRRIFLWHLLSWETGCRVIHSPLLLRDLYRRACE